MFSEIKYTITPEEVVSSRTHNYKKRGQWLDFKYCPFCEGGNKHQVHTFAVHQEKGFYYCLRTSCGAKGNFWKLLEFYGYDPRKYIDKSNGFKRKVEKKKKYIYGK